MLPHEDIRHDAVAVGCIGCVTFPTGECRVYDYTTLRAIVYYHTMSRLTSVAGLQVVEDSNPAELHKVSKCFSFLCLQNC